MNVVVLAGRSSEWKEFQQSVFPPHLSYVWPLSITTAVGMCVCVLYLYIGAQYSRACERKSKHWSVNGIPMETSDQASSVSPKPFLHFSPVCIFKCSLKHPISVNENLVPEPVQPSDWQVECFECFHRKDSNDASSMSQKVKNIGKKLNWSGCLG